MSKGVPESRRLGVAILVTLAAAAVFALAAVERAEGYTAYVTNQNSNSVSVIDTTTNAIAGADIPVGVFPIGVAANPNGTRAYVANSSDDTVSVIDTATGAVVGPPVAVGGTPWGVAITPDGSRAYVANQTGSVSVIETTTNTLLVPDIAIGGASTAIAFTPSGASAYTANLGGDVSRLDALSNSYAPPDITVGTTPAGIAATPDGSSVYVTNQGDDTVSEIATATNTLADTITVGDAPIGIAISPDGGSAYVTNQIDGTVSVIDTATNAVVDTVTVGIGPEAIAITPDGATTYVTNQTDGTVSVIDTATNTLAAPDITVGALPRGIAIFTRPGAAVVSQAAPLPPPVPGKTFNAEPVEGIVKRKCKGDENFVPLTAPEQLQIGCLIDTRNGTVRLISARGPGGATQSSLFWAGIFRVDQDLASRLEKTRLEKKGGGKKGRRKFETVLTLAGSLGCRKGNRDRAGDSSPSSEQRARKGSGRKLWGSGSGKFTSEGKRGAASVRGTTWLVADRCDDSTLVRVKEGVVRFRDFVNDRTVVVRAGERYVAQRRG